MIHVLPALISSWAPIGQTWSGYRLLDGAQLGRITHRVRDKTHAIGAVTQSQVGFRLSNTLRFPDPRRKLPLQIPIARHTTLPVLPLPAVSSLEAYKTPAR